MRNTANCQLPTANLYSHLGVPPSETQGVGLSASIFCNSQEAKGFPLQSLTQMALHPALRGTTIKKLQKFSKLLKFEITNNQ